MLYRANIAAIISAMTALLLPLIALADGGHEGSESAAAVSAPSAASITLLIMSIVCGLVVAALLYFLPKTRPGPLQLAVAGLGAITTMIHLLLGLDGDLLLLVNGLGSGLLLVLLFVPIGPQHAQRTPILILALLIYTFITFVGYFVTHPADHYSTVGLASKGVEFVLMACLGIWWMQARSVPATVAGD